MVIYVTQAHIDQGESNRLTSKMTRCESCAVALAINAALGVSVSWVDKYGCYRLIDRTYYRPLPADVIERIHKMDEGLRVAPFSFEFSER